MSNKLTAALIGVVLVVIVALSSTFVVNEREQAIVLRFGEIQRVETEPGLYFKLPFGIFNVDTVQKVEDRLLRLDLDNLRVQVSGGKFYDVDAFLTYKVEDAQRFRQQVSASLERAEANLRTRFDATLRQVYGRRGFEAALSEERNEMMREVAAALRPAAAALGVAVEDVRIRRTDLTPEVSQQTFERMKAERFAEAERLRARGTEAARRIRAAANRQVVEVRAEAQRDSEVLRGEGEGERNRIFADAFTQDPEFFEFYRSMSAYRKALENSGTTLVLSPDSEFFRFFQDAGGPGSAATVTPGSGSGSNTSAAAAAAEASAAAATDEASVDGTASPVTSAPTNATRAPAAPASTDQTTTSVPLVQD